jgi:hypothetical protein
VLHSNGSEFFRYTHTNTASLFSWQSRGSQNRALEIVVLGDVESLPRLLRVIRPSQNLRVDMDQFQSSSRMQYFRQVKTQHGLPAGTYFLEIELSIWAYFTDENQFRSKWNSQGRRD